MKINEQPTVDVYEPPRVEMTIVQIEKGFAISSVGVDLDPWGNGGHLGDYDVE